MAKMFVRVKKDGFLFDYCEMLAKHPSCEVVAEEIAFPERFVPAHAVERLLPPVAEAAFVAAPAVRLRGQGGKKVVKEAPIVTKPEDPAQAILNLFTDDIPEEPKYTEPQLAKDAAKGFPK